VQCQYKFSVQQRIKCSGHAAARTIQAGKTVELADGIIMICGGVEKEKHSDYARQRGRQEDGHEARNVAGDFGWNRLHSNGASMPAQAGWIGNEFKNTQPEGQ